MKNITEEIKRAIQTNIPWSIDQFYLFLENIKVEGLEISYSDDDEENWATIVVDGDSSVGYVWKKSPLVLMTEKHIKALPGLWQNFDYVTLINVSDLNAEELIINSDQLLLERLRHPVYNKPVSATSIWFYNVT